MSGSEPPDIRWVGMEDLIKLNESMIDLYTPDEQCGVKDYGALESARCAPFYHRYYEQTQDVFILAAVLMSRLAKNHPFHNANKRTAFGAAMVFLEMNGYELNAPPGETLELMEGLAGSYGSDEGYSEREVATWLNDNAKPLYDSSLALNKNGGTQKPE